MRKLFCLVMSLLLLFSIVPSWEAEAADDIIFLGTNDRLWDLSLKVMPINIDGKIYVPYAVFKEGLGTKAVHNETNKTLVLYEWNDTVLFNLAKGSSEAGKDMSYYPDKAVEKNGNIYVPAEFVCKMLKYDYYYNSKYPLLRMKTAEGLASNERFVQAASPMLEGIKNNYIKSLPPDPIPVQPPDQSKKNKVAYLTFDDGPNTPTAEILDVLDRYNVKAVFFVLGSNIYRNSSIMRRIYAEGHIIGLHSHTHVKNSFYSSPEGMLKELEDCNTALYKTIKKRTHLIRTPYGSKPYLTSELRDALAENGYRFWDWNVDSRDSVVGATSASVLSAVKSQTANKTNAIILMHCKSITAKALPDIITHLRQNGFTIKTFDETDTPVNFYFDFR